MHERKKKREDHSPLCIDQTHARVQQLCLGLAHRIQTTEIKEREREKVELSRSLQFVYQMLGEKKSIIPRFQWVAP